MSILLLLVADDDKSGSGQGVVNDHDIECAGDDREHPAEVPGLVALVLQLVDRLALPVPEGSVRLQAGLLALLGALLRLVRLTGQAPVAVLIGNALIVAEERPDLGV